MNIVTRAEWGARPPKSTTRLPATKPGLTLHWEGPATGTFTHDKCPGRVQGIQRFHMDGRGWNDIAYNFLVCPHGTIYEGRGWGTQSAANGTTAGNQSDHAACYLGGQGDPFTRPAKTAFVWLRDESDRRYQQTTLVRPHSAHKPTECPGDVIRNWIPKMPTPQQEEPPVTDADKEAIADLVVAKLLATDLRPKATTGPKTVKQLLAWAGVSGWRIHRKA